MASEAISPESSPIRALPEPPAEDAGRLNGASRGRLIAILVSLVLLNEVATFQVVMVSVIVPKIGLSFPVAGSSVSWAVTILGVVGGATMGIAGKLADLLGKKRILVFSSLLFLVGTLLCALTSTWAVFLVGRGIASASWGMTAVAYGLVRDIMPRKWIPVSVGVLGTGFGLATVLGPLVVGALTDHFSWRSAFWFLAIYMVVMLPLFMAVVPESPYRVRQRFDVLGATLFGAGVGAVLIYVSEGSNWGWTNMGCVAYLIGGLVALLVFVWWEGRATDPMMELSLLRAPKVSILMVLAFLFTGIATTVNFAVAYMFQTPRASDLKQQILDATAAQSHLPAQAIAPFVHFQGDISYGAGFSVLQMALHITMWTALFGMIFGLVGGVLARRVGCRILLITAGVALLAACLLWVPWHSTWQEQLFIGILFGISFGFYFAGNPNLLMDAVPASRQGISAGMLAVFGGVGTSTATALFTAITSAHPFQMVASFPGRPSVVTNIPQVYADAGYSQVYLLIGVVPCAVALVLALALRTGRSPALGGEATTVAA